MISKKSQLRAILNKSQINDKHIIKINTNQAHHNQINQRQVRRKKKRAKGPSIRVQCKWEQMAKSAKFTSVRNVHSILIDTLTWYDIWKFIQMRDHINVIFAHEHSAPIPYYAIILTLTWELNHISARSQTVKWRLWPVVNWRGTGDTSTLMKNHSNVHCVIMPQSRFQNLDAISGHIRANDHFRAISAERPLPIVFTWSGINSLTREKSHTSVHTVRRVSLSMAHSRCTLCNNIPKLRPNLNVKYVIHCSAENPIWTSIYGSNTRTKRFQCNVAIVMKCTTIDGV